MYIGFIDSTGLDHIKCINSTKIITIRIFIELQYFMTHRKLPGHAKISQLCMAVVVEQDVARLYVTVDLGIFGNNFGYLSISITKLYQQLFIITNTTSY